MTVAAVPLAEWWTAGARVPVQTGEGAAELFVWEGGQGPVVTLLHGYPGSSHDWSAVATDLAADHRVIIPDLLGFGASDKPFPHRYSIREQADLVEQMWAARGITATALVAHDYSSSVAQELLRRSSPAVHSATFLNGAVHPHLHRPTDGQLLLLGPDGDALAALITEELWTEALAATFGPRHPLTPEVAAELWTAFAHGDGSRLAAALLHYVGDRAVDGDAWVAAMEAARVPTAFVWGSSDPVSGDHVISEVERRMPGTPVTRLDGVGHWPMLEDPVGVIEALRAQLG